MSLSRVVAMSSSLYIDDAQHGYFLVTLVTLCIGIGSMQKMFLEECYTSTMTIPLQSASTLMKYAESVTMAMPGG